MSQDHASRARVVADIETPATNVEETRAFLQERLRLFGLWVFLVAFGFFVVIAAAQLALDPSLGALTRVAGPSAIHVAGCLAAALLWIVTRRARLRLSMLRRLDAGTVIAVCTAFALEGGGIAAANAPGVDDPRIALFIVLLAAANTVIARAVSVPSRPARTAWISVVSLAPVVLSSGYAIGAGAGEAASAMTLIVLVGWCGVAVVNATIASQVIFGLRREAERVRQLGQYRLGERIGQGGMGVVYRAHHVMLRRPTAIKLLPPDRAGEANLRRFEREVQHTARLTHPNTIAIFDYGRTPDGLFYYAMELLDGLNLDELVRRYGPQPPGRVIHLLRQVCGALAEAHESGLIHRDIKPANIIVTERGREPDVVKVVDFGLVRQIDDVGAGLTVTGANVITGTPLYMSPESIRSEQRADARSDLYALGAVAYFLLAGVPVFEGPSLVDICAHHLQTEPVPPSRRGDRHVPADLEAVVLACLSKAPDRRPQTARELRSLLDGCTDAGAWSTALAATWWEAHRRDAQSAPVVTMEEAPQSLTVDLATRAAGV